VDRLGQDLLLGRHLRLEVEDPALPEEEVADRVLDLLAKGGLDHLGGEEAELGEGLPQTAAVDRAVGEGLEELLLVEVAVQEQVLAVDSAGSVDMQATISPL